MSLRVDRVSFAYPHSGTLVVDDVSAEARPGCITAIIGPNAVGKSTLLRLMAGLLTPDRGTVRLGEVDAPFTIREVVALGRFALPEAPQAVSVALDQCGLTDTAEQVFNTLSVGQQQRTALARALAQVHGRPDAAMLLDEPTSALDPRHVQQTARVLRQSAAAGRAVVVILHDLILARSLSDEAWILHEGRLVAAGPTPEICQPALLERVYGVRFVLASDIYVAQAQ